MLTRGLSPRGLSDGDVARLVRRFDMIERMFPKVLARLMAFSAAMGGPQSIREIAVLLEQSVEAAAPAERKNSSNASER